MTLLDSVVGMVKPGRFDDFLAQALEATKLFERIGGSPRLAIAVSTGEPVDTWTFGVEYPTAEAWGEAMDGVNADVEFQAFFNRVRSADSPTAITSTTLSTEIPVRDGNRARGNVIEIHVVRPIPGKMEQNLELTGRVFELVEARGATNARLFQLGYAGLGSGLLMLSWECENMKAHGRLADQWMADPELAEIGMSARFGDDIATTPVFDGLYQVVPI